MKQITFWFDVISPYAYLAFEKLPETLLGHSYSVDYRPVLFAGLLKHHGQLGPAEIAGKRDWTYRQVLWQAQRSGVALQMPAAHPFNPLGLLRLALACGQGGSINRHVAESVFRHVWQGGHDATDAQRSETLRAALAPTNDPSGEAVKAQLKANTEAAIARDIFGVPTIEADGKLFWGFDALPMLRDCLDGHAWFGGGDWEAAGRVAVGGARASVRLGP